MVTFKVTQSSLYFFVHMTLLYYINPPDSNPLDVECQAGKQFAPFLSLYYDSTKV